MIASLRFAGNLHPLLVAGIALLAALAVAKLYLRETRSLGSPYNYLLPGLRATAVALVILILAAPVWHRRQVVGTLGRVIFAIDQSQSMSVTDSIASDANPKRLDRAIELLTGNDSTAGWIEQLQTTHTIDVVAFSDGDVSNVWTSRNSDDVPISFDLKPHGHSTALASGMLTAGDTAGDATPTAIVLLTEGRGNAGPSAIDMAVRMKSLGVKVHAIGLGSADEPDDIGIVGIQYPNTASADAPLAGTILLRQSGLRGKQAMIRIDHQGTTVWRQPISIESTEVSVPFEVDLQSIVDQIDASAPRGVQRRIAVMDLLAMIQPIDGEHRTENNSRSFRVAVSTNQNRLLIVDGSSRWEMRYLRNLFARDPEWSVDVILYGPGTDTAFVKRGSEPGQFPDSADAIGRYDAIVLGEVPPEQWSENDSLRLREFVTRGGGLIVIDGRYDRVRQLVQQSLSDLVPVTFLEASPLPVRAIQPSRLGVGHPALDLGIEPADQSKLWEKLPPPPSAPSLEAQTGSEVLAEVITIDGGRTPWLVTRLFGAGRVVYVSTDQTWRWRYKVADRFHARFWNQSMATVTQPPYSAGDSYVALGTDKIEYRQGESVTIRARLRDTSSQPIGDSTVEAVLISQNEVVARVPLEVDDPARGTYRGISGPLRLGEYSVRIRASGISQQALQATTPIWVQNRDRGELDRVSLDASTLQQIANSGGGVYLHESEADRIMKQLEPLSSGQIVETDFLVWQSFYWFIAVMMLLTVEWWMRKRAGLM